MLIYENPEIKNNIKNINGYLLKTVYSKNDADILIESESWVLYRYYKISETDNSKAKERFVLIRFKLPD